MFRFLILVFALLALLATSTSAFFFRRRFGYGMGGYGLGGMGYGMGGFYRPYGFFG